MTRPDEDLIPGETHLLTVSRHPVVLLARTWKWVVLILLVVVVGAVFVNPQGGQLSNLRWFILAGLVLVLLVYLDVQYVIWRSETYTLTDQRVLLRRGVIGKFSRSISMARVQDVTTSQGLLGRLLDYGTVEVESAGQDGAEVLTYVPDPTRFRNLLFERLHPELNPTVHNSSL
ncbi:MAG TPA: PH domain-containing protein [Candidatus Dormibacteraeota bacterium]|jgi:uncharacterized membrane protein YdbT with pleckstrin-like domain|nr:PH domain-containing protein [Candidatus Dormibacteraeota bacterium]